MPRMALGRHEGGMSEEKRMADLLEQALCIDEFSVALDRRHALYPPDTRRVQRA